MLERARGFCDLGRGLVSVFAAVALSSTRTTLPLSSDATLAWFAAAMAAACALVNEFSPMLRCG